MVAPARTAGGLYPSVFVGAPWWFLDTPDGMRRFRRSVTDTWGSSRRQASSTTLVPSARSGPARHRSPDRRRPSSRTGRDARADGGQCARDSGPHHGPLAARRLPARMTALRRSRWGPPCARCIRPWRLLPAHQAWYADGPATTGGSLRSWGIPRPPGRAPRAGRALHPGDPRARGRRTRRDPKRCRGPTRRPRARGLAGSGPHPASRSSLRRRPKPAIGGGATVASTSATPTLARILRSAPTYERGSGLPGSFSWSWRPTARRCRADQPDPLRQPAEERSQRCREPSLELADLVDPSLAVWIATSVTYPSSVVDRIMPRTMPEDVRTLAAAGIDDLAPATTEPFSEWVLSGDLGSPRRPWEDVGVWFAEDIATFEQRKLGCSTAGTRCWSTSARSVAPRRSAEAWTTTPPGPISSSGGRRRLVISRSGRGDRGLPRRAGRRFAN